MSAISAPMTSEELFALPDADKFERWLINGELREQEMTLRSPIHAGPIVNVSALLLAWCQQQPRPRPKPYAGDIYFRLCREPATNVGVDVAIASAEQVAALHENSRYVDGAPMLAVEILSASDTLEATHEKIAAYLDNGTPVLWLVDPFDRTVTVYRPGEEPVMFNQKQELSGDPELPGFRCRVAEIFE